MTRSEVLAGLKAGRALIIDNKANEFLPWLLKLEGHGLVASEFVQYDEQSSAIKFRMLPTPPAPAEKEVL